LIEFTLQFLLFLDSESIILHNILNHGANYFTNEFKKVVKKIEVAKDFKLKEKKGRYFCLLRSKTYNESIKERLQTHKQTFINSSMMQQVA
jgi:hypothetical protein